MQYAMIAAALVGAVMAAPSVAPPAYGDSEVEAPKEEAPAAPPAYEAPKETESSPEAPSNTDTTVYVTITSCSADVKDCPATAVPTVPAGGEGHDLPSYTAPSVPAEETPVTGGEGPKSPSTNPPHVSPPKDEGEGEGKPPVYGGEEDSPSMNPPHLSPSAPVEAPATPTGYESDSTVPEEDEEAGHESDASSPPAYGEDSPAVPETSDVPATPETPASPETPETPETGYESDAEAGEEAPVYGSGEEAAPAYPGEDESSPVAPYPVANGTSPVYPTGTAAPAPSGSAGGAYPPTQIGNGASGLKVAGLFTAMGAVAAFFL